MKKYKYIHIFVCDGVGFALLLAEMIYDVENRFDISEHLFVTNRCRIYEKMEEKYNIEYANPQNPASLINIYAPKCDWLICHSMPLVHNNLIINPIYLNKIIWRTWGHDVGYSYEDGKYFKNCVKRILETLWKRQVRSFQAVGIANTVDAIDISNRFGNVKTYRMPYPRKRDDLFEQVEQRKFEKKDLKYRVLLGHSGFSNDNHIEILKKLKMFPEDNLEIYLVLSYGNQVYINTLCKYIEKNNINNVVIIDKYLEIEDYIDFLSNMDIAILDGEKSYALGNLSWLLKAQKKIFLNRNGIIKKAFDLDGIPYKCTDELENMTYEEFIKPLLFKNIKTEMYPHTYQENVDAWYSTLSDLSKNSIYRR